MNQIVPVLCASGSGALAWWQIRNTPLGATAAGAELHEVYRRFRLSALLHEREIAYVFSLLRAAGIEAVLVKGWAIARRYPDIALRPYGDIDICVAPDQIEEAAHALRCLENLEGHFVDLHSGFGEVGRTKSVQSPKSNVQRPSGTPTVREGPGVPIGSTALPNGRGSAWDGHWTLDIGHWTCIWDEVFARSSVVECGGEPVRIPADEDHLRLLSMHLLRSGAWRPAWLCDVALLLEARQVSSFKFQVPSFPNRVAVTDSSRGLSARRDTPGSHGISVSDPEGVKEAFGHWTALHANWVRTTMVLAHELLGADISNTPFADERLPRWLVPALLKQWGRSKNDRRRTTEDGGSQTEDGRPTTGMDLPRSSVVGRRSLFDLGHWTNLYRRWDNPIRATAAVGGEFNNWPRLPYRLAESLMRLPELGKAVGRKQKEEGRRQTLGAQASCLHGAPRGAGKALAPRASRHRPAGRHPNRAARLGTPRCALPAGDAPVDGRTQ